MEHIDIAQLIDHFESPANCPLASEANDHIRKCSKCARLYRKLDHLFATLGQRLEEVPQATTARLLNIYQRRPRMVEPKSAAKYFLVFDDWSMATNERHSGSDRRHLLFRVKNCDIDLRLQFTDEKCAVSGQIFPSSAHTRVTLSRGREIEETFTSDLSEFVFPSVPLGSYDLTINASDEQITLRDLTLTP